MKDDARRTRDSTDAPTVHLNLNVRGLSPSATLAINELSLALMSQGRRIFRLGLGQSPFPIPEPVVESLRRHAHCKDYLAVRGLDQLREAVAAYHHRAQGVDRDGEHVLIGPGSKELMFLLQMVYYGDLVVARPSWVSYAPQASIIGRHVRWISTSAANQWKLHPDDLERVCQADPDRPRIVVLNYPNNPTGQTHEPEELAALARIARRYRVVMLSDEIYGEIEHDGRHVSIAEYYPEGTIISTGLSKWCGAGGWRLGTFSFPANLQWLLDAMGVVASETFTATSAPIQFAAVTAFSGGPYIDNYLRLCRRVLKALGHDSAARMRTAGLELSAPRGAFYLFPNFRPFRRGLHERGIRTSRDLCQRLLEDTGVAALPGSNFGRPATELTIRLAYVDFDGAAALEAAAAPAAEQHAQLDAAFVRQHCGNVVDAIERLINWLPTPDA